MATDAAGQLLPQLPGEAVEPSDARRDHHSRSADESSKEQGVQDKKILVLGATGATGRLIVQALRSQGAKVVAGVRSTSTAAAQLGLERGEELQFLEVDIARDSPRRLAQAVKGCDAVICAAGYKPSFPPDPFGPLKVDYMGTKKLVDACVDAQVPKFVLITSLLTNGLLSGQALNPQFILLNSFGGILFAKRKAEMYLEGQAFLDWTIVRPGGLKSQPASGSIVYGAADVFAGGGISRTQVAEVAVQACVQKAASRKIVEIIARTDASPVTYEDGFASC